MHACTFLTNVFANFRKLSSIWRAPPLGPPQCRPLVFPLRTEILVLATPLAKEISKGTPCCRKECEITITAATEISHKLQLNLEMNNKKDKYFRA